MLYLAEVQKQKTGPFGSRTVLQLLACQRTDQSWSTVPGEETVPAEEASRLNEGALVIVNLGNNRQVQGEIEPAGGRLASVLQTFSRLVEKSKSQEEEIEQWKQSLTYQSQELNRREMEMEARLEQLQAMEEEFERLEQQRQELEGVQEETTRLREEYERNREELEGAWEHLRGEQRRLEELRTEVQTVGLDENQVRAVQEILERLSGSVAPTSNLREQLNLAFEVVNAQQSWLDHHWQELEQQQAEASRLQSEASRQGEELHNRKRELQQTQASLEQAKAELKVQHNALEMKQESVHMLSLQLRTQVELHQQLARLATTTAGVTISQKVDIDALEKMPLGELQELVQNLQQELEKVMRFVNDQEEELTFQRQAVQELQARMNEASEYDRLALETELTDEQDRYQLLDESLIGSRRNLREREEILNQHLRMLRRRQGVVDSNASDNGSKIDLGPVLNQLEEQRQQQESELQKLESQIEQMRLSISQAEEMIRHQANEHEHKQQELQSLEQNWQSSKEAAAELSAQIKVYQETVQPRQESLNQIRQNLDEIAQALNQIQETGDYQLQAIAQLQQTIGSFV
ncbi:MAG TPA: pilus motility taxis protein HmpF [Allocoleopsis sp.]